MEKHVTSTPPPPPTKKKKKIWYLGTGYLYFNYLQPVDWEVTINVGMVLSWLHAQLQYSSYFPASQE